jgi:hypothetical protein
MMKRRLYSFVESVIASNRAGSKKEIYQMAKVKKQPLTDPDEEKLAQDVVACIKRDGTYWDSPDELLLIDEDELLERLGSEPEPDNEDDWDAQMFAQRLNPYSLQERRRILGRAEALADE